MYATESGLAESGKHRAATVLRTLAGASRGAGTVAEVAHDTRNMVAALSLYCDLLAEPGVLSEAHGHYAGELRLIASASRRLVEKLSSLDANRGQAPEDVDAPSFRVGPQPPTHARETLPGEPVENLQQEVLATRNLLDAIAGLGVRVLVRTEGGARPVSIASEDLTRVLVNLVRNAAEAMHSAGVVEITVRETPAMPGSAATVELLVEDTGPGIAPELLERIFEPEFTSHGDPQSGAGDGWPRAHRGLGLSITRSIVQKAGGHIVAENRSGGGARFRVDLPVRQISQPDQHL